MAFHQKRKCHTDGDVQALFILGAPRTGSTLLYQILINAFNFYYFNNLTARLFSRSPSAGAWLTHQLSPFLKSYAADYQSLFGKTAGWNGPSEASYIFRNWFGSRHPSEIYSAQILPHKESHFLKTFRFIYFLYRKPVLTKNAWNCFRVQEIKRILPRAKFLWIRRSIIDSAYSDYRSRLAHGGPHVWNSATTADYEEIIKLEPYQQVVEQQQSYNTAIEKQLSKLNSKDYHEVWYENLCDDSQEEVKRIAIFLENDFDIERKSFTFPAFKKNEYSKDDIFENISRYVESKNYFK